MGPYSILCVLGSLLYLLDTADISPLLTQLGLLHHLFADDVQADPRDPMTHTDPRDAETALTKMSRSIDALTTWMASNRLLLNSQLRPYGSVAAGNLQRLTFSGCPRITFSTCVRDFGVMLDPELIFSHHIYSIARKCYYQLRQIPVVSRSLTHQSTLILVHAFV